MSIAVGLLEKDSFGQSERYECLATDPIIRTTSRGCRIAGGWLSGHHGWGEGGCDAGPDLSEPFDIFSSEFIGQFPLDRRDGITHSPQRRMAAFGQVNACEAPVLRVVVTFEVSEGLKLTEVMVERLLGESGVRGDLDRPPSVGAGVAQDDQVCGDQVLETASSVSGCFIRFCRCSFR